MYQVSFIRLENLHFEWTEIPPKNNLEHLKYYKVGKSDYITPQSCMCAHISIIYSLQSSV